MTAIVVLPSHHALAQQSTDKIRPATYNWSGGYVGVLIGLNSIRTSHDSFAVNPVDLNAKGRVSGILAGYNYTSGDWVAGPEIDVSYGILEATGNGHGIKSDFYTSLRARVGRRINRALPYITGGLTLTAVDYKSSLPANSAHDLQLGLTAGGGIELAVGPRLSARIEYLYGRSIGNDRFDLDETHQIRAAAAYQFKH